MKNVRFVPYTTNQGSYDIRAVDDDRVFQKPGAPVVLVKCVRKDHEDNERGYKLTQAICTFLNGLSPEERWSYLSNEQEPPAS